MHKETLKHKVIVDNDNNIGYEINSLFKRGINFFLIPLLNILPVKSRGLIKKSHASVREIVDNATSHKALEIIYKNGISGHTKSFFSKISHKVWFNTNNSKAARNRLKLVKREIESSILEIIKSKNEINIVSIAAGSARAIIESLESTILDKNIKLNVMFVDKNPKALEYSYEFFQNSPLKELSNANFSWQEQTVNTFLDNCELSFDIIEMVGLMDYFSDDKALTIFKKIYNITSPNGYFVTANINDNSEKNFVTKAIGWPMIYRRAEEIGSLVADAGFTHTDMRLFYEPLKIHSVIIAKK